MKRITLFLTVTISIILCSCNFDKTYVIKGVKNVETSIDSTGDIVVLATVENQGKDVIARVREEFPATILLVAKEHNRLQDVTVGLRHYSRDSVYSIEGATLRKRY